MLLPLMILLLPLARVVDSKGGNLQLYTAAIAPPNEEQLLQGERSYGCSNSSYSSKGPIDKSYSVAKALENARKATSQ